MSFNNQAHLDEFLQKKDANNKYEYKVYLQRAMLGAFTYTPRIPDTPDDTDATPGNFYVTPQQNLTQQQPETIRRIKYSDAVHYGIPIFQLASYHERSKSIFICWRLARDMLLAREGPQSGASGGFGFLPRSGLLRI